MVRLGECGTLIRLSYSDEPLETPALVTGVWGGSDHQEINCVSVREVSKCTWGRGVLELGTVEHHPRVPREGLHDLARRFYRVGELEKDEEPARAIPYAGCECGDPT